MSGGNKKDGDREREYQFRKPGNGLTAKKKPGTKPRTPTGHDAGVSEVGARREHAEAPPPPWCKKQKQFCRKTRQHETNVKLATLTSHRQTSVPLAFNLSATNPPPEFPLKTTEPSSWIAAPFNVSSSVLPSCRPHSFVRPRVRCCCWVFR